MSIMAGGRARKRSPEHAGALHGQITKDQAMRQIVTAIPVLLLLSLVAAAQEQDRDLTVRTPPPPPTAGGTLGIPQAPVGHRQPTQGSLPPSVLKEEGTTGRATVDDLGPLPKICRNC